MKREESVQKQILQSFGNSYKLSVKSAPYSSVGVSFHTNKGKKLKVKFPVMSSSFIKAIKQCLGR